METKSPSQVPATDLARTERNDQTNPSAASAPAPSANPLTSAPTSEPAVNIRRLPADLSQSIGLRPLLHLCLDSVQLWPAEALREARNRHPEARPEMVVTLLTYCYSIGLYDSTDIEWTARTDRTLRYICAGTKVPWQMLRRFRRTNRDLLEASLVHVMKQAWAFYFEKGEADYAGYDWFETELVREFHQAARVRLDVAALLDGADGD